MNRPRRARSACPLVLAALICLLTEPSSAAAPQAKATTRASTLPTRPVTGPAADAPLRVHIISGSKEYASEPSLKRWKEEMERRYHVTVTASWGQDGGTSLDNLQELGRAEVLLLFARRMNLPEAQMKLIRAHWEAGKPVVGVRTASHAFGPDDNDAFDRRVLGGIHRSHGTDDPVKVSNESAQADHPILRGVGPFNSRKLYRRAELADGVVVLQTGDNGKERQPVTVTHTYRGARVVYTSLGVPEDFENQNFRRLLTNSVFWATHRDPERMKKTN